MSVLAANNQELRHLQGSPPLFKLKHLTHLKPLELQKRPKQAAQKLTRAASLLKFRGAERTTQTEDMTDSKPVVYRKVLTRTFTLKPKPVLPQFPSILVRSDSSLNDSAENKKGCTLWSRKLNDVRKRFIAFDLVHRRVSL